MIRLIMLCLFDERAALSVNWHREAIPIGLMLL
jgi:hypothetical protein